MVRSYAEARNPSSKWRHSATWRLQDPSFVAMQLLYRVSHLGRVQLLLHALWTDTNCSQLVCLSCIALIKHIHLEALAVRRCLWLLVSFDVFNVLPAPFAGDNMLDDCFLLIRDLWVRYKQSRQMKNGQNHSGRSQAVWQIKSTQKQSKADQKQSKAVKSSLAGHKQSSTEDCHWPMGAQTPTRVYQV